MRGRLAKRAVQQPQSAAGSVPSLSSSAPGHLPVSPEEFALSRCACRWHHSKATGGRAVSPLCHRSAALSRSCSAEEGSAAVAADFLPVAVLGSAEKLWVCSLHMLKENLQKRSLGGRGVDRLSGWQKEALPSRGDGRNGAAVPGQTSC